MEQGRGSATILLLELPSEAELRIYVLQSALVLCLSVEFVLWHKVT